MFWAMVMKKDKSKGKAVVCYSEKDNLGIIYASGSWLDYGVRLAKSLGLKYRQGDDYVVIVVRGGEHRAWAVATMISDDVQRCPELSTLVDLPDSEEDAIADE